MLHRHILYRDAHAHIFQVDKAQGEFLYDPSGKKYIDFTSGWNVANLGWNHPEVVEAIREQLDKGTGVGMWHSCDIQNRFAEALTAALPPELNCCIRTTGGTEAIEVSIKVARTVTSRPVVIGFKKAYHGQLFASMALGAPEIVHKHFDPLVPQIEQWEYPVTQDDLADFLAKLETRLAKSDVAALVTEAGVVTGSGSAVVPAQGYLKKMQELLRKYGTLLIIDEVGTGFSRTGGAIFAIQREGIVPDIVVFAKAIANGSGTLSTAVIREVYAAKAGAGANLISTFGWNPLAAAAALRTLEIHQRERTWKMAEAKGKIVFDFLRDLEKKGLVQTIRGYGLEIGVQISEDAKFERIELKARANGLIIKGNRMEFFQIMPPLTIAQKSLEIGLAIFADALKA
jgi:4-aminobutyrate aminotransferase-like enzyme